MSKLTKRLTAMLLAGMLLIGSVPGSVFAADVQADPGVDSRVAVEEVTEESVDVVSEDVEDTAVEDESADAAGKEHAAGVLCPAEGPFRAGQETPVSRMQGFRTLTLKLPEKETYLVQELTLPVYHFLCAELEKYFFT